MNLTAKIFCEKNNLRLNQNRSVLPTVSPPARRYVFTVHPSGNSPPAGPEAISVARVHRSPVASGMARATFFLLPLTSTPPDSLARLFFLGGDADEEVDNVLSGDGFDSLLFLSLLCSDLEDVSFFFDASLADVEDMLFDACVSRDHELIPPLSGPLIKPAAPLPPPEIKIEYESTTDFFLHTKVLESLLLTCICSSKSCATPRCHSTDTSGRMTYK